MSDTITNNIEMVGGDDIEKNILSNNDDTNTNTSNDGAETEAPPADPAPAPAPASVSVMARLISVLRIPLIVIGVIAFTPILSLVVLVISSIWGWDCFDPQSKAEEEEKYKGKLYEKVQLYLPSELKLRTGSGTMVTCRLGFVLLLWLLLSTLALQPALKTSTFLGLIHWKWSLLATFLVLSHPFISTNLYVFGEAYRTFVVDHGSQPHYYSYYIWMGLFNSLVSLLHITSVFLLWMLYFHPHAGLNDGFDKYATMTLVALLVAALLWLLKTALLLRWKQKAVCEKFRTRILMSGFRLSTLLCLIDGEADSLLLPCRFLPSKDITKVLDYSESPFFSKRDAREYIVSSTHVSLQQIQEVAKMLTVLTKITRSSDDAYQLSTITDIYQQKIDPFFSKEATTTILIDSELGGFRSTLLKDVLLQEYPTKDINQVPFDKWVVDAHKSCLSAAFTLTDAFATVRVLDTILTSCLVIVVILVWLLATQLASTTVLVVIASPFLALSFIFGDICKTFFQGFIFAFINHPFDIGDRCMINGDEVEVKRVNIMTTTCVKIGTNEKMMYPNSKLAADLIINLGDKLDPTDVLELVLHPSTKVNDILEMKKNIENFIDSDEQRHMFEKAHEVVVKEINSGIKIIVSFQHALDRKDITYSQFLVKREARRSTLFVEIKKIRESLGLEVATS